MFFETQGTEHYHDDAQMHHFLDTNLYRARPRVRILFENFILYNRQLLENEYVFHRSRIKF